MCAFKRVSAFEDEGVVDEVEVEDEVVDVEEEVDVGIAEVVVARAGVLVVIGVVEVGI